MLGRSDWEYSDGRWKEDAVDSGLERLQCECTPKETRPWSINLHIMCGDPPGTPDMPLTPFIPLIPFIPPTPMVPAPPAGAEAEAAAWLDRASPPLPAPRSRPAALLSRLEVDEALLGCRSSALLWMLMGLLPSPATLPLARSWASAPTPAVLAVTSVFLDRG